MRSFLRLGPANLALVSIYFVPVWGAEAMRALMSPYGGFDDRAQATASTFFQHLFDFGHDGLMRTSNALAGLKLVVATAFVAYVIEFARGLAVGREPDRATVNAVLALALIAIAIMAAPAFAFDDAALIRAFATQFLLLTGAMILIVVERHIDPSMALGTPPVEGAPLSGDCRPRLGGFSVARTGEGAR